MKTRVDQKVVKVGYDDLAHAIEKHANDGWNVAALAQSGDDSEGPGWLYLVVFQRPARGPLG